jgi:hypothetical protein
MPIRFDRSRLPPAQLEFVVVADTHYMIDVGDTPLEFESRRKQGQRAGAAWAAIEGVDPEFVVHLGDMVQEFPGRPDYERTMSQALGQIKSAGLWERCRFVVGNHDIGDRPDPTMPTGEATTDSLDNWQGRFGPSWYTWSAAGLHFLVLNSQLFNTDLPAAHAQRAWCARQLESFGADPLVLFLHMPPYLSHATEPWLGHYDNLGEPDRSWLLDHLRQRQVIAMFTGHVHWQFFDRIPGEHGDCRYFVTPSTSFTRPGFAHLFNSAAPAEQGRDDVAKTGFFLCRKVEGRLDVHRIRMSAVADDGRSALITPLAAAAAPSRRFELGVTLRHTLAPHAQVPVAWPSVIRQPVRNDYPLLSCTEMGARWVRTPVADLADSVQAPRHEVLRQEGVGIVAVALGEEEALKYAGLISDRADHLEVQLPGRRLPLPDPLPRLVELGCPLSLCPVLPGQPVAGKQHHRTRLGYLPAELLELADCLEQLQVDAGAVCRIDPTSPWKEVAELASIQRRHPWNLSLLAQIPGTDEVANANAVARAIFAAAAVDVPLFLEPLIDMDRTMDVVHGLLDTLCNPRPTFDLVRSMTALLRDVGPGTPTIDRRRGHEVIRLGDRCILLLPSDEPQPLAELLDPIQTQDSSRICQCATATISAFDPEILCGPESGPLLILP